MRKVRRIPRMLFRYRRFTNHTLDELVSDQLYFADPSTFNDPLETRPALAADLDAPALEEILRQLVEKRVADEMKAAANQIEVKGPKLHEHITAHGRWRAEQVIKEVKYFASDPEHEGDDAEQTLLRRYIEDELLRRYDKGIVSLAERSECPLMWGHYGDQHKGLCIGYSIPNRVADNLYKVSYGGSRLIKAKAVAAMLKAEIDSRILDQDILARKARDWRYEREWRLLGRRGVQDSPLELKEVVFGLRCSNAVRYVIVEALANRRRPIKFFEIRELRESYRLAKRPFDTIELRHRFPRRSLDVFDEFSEIATS